MCHVSGCSSSSSSSQCSHDPEVWSFSLLEFAANDDVEGLKQAVEEKGASSAGACANWYCRQIGSNKMAWMERSPIMIAALFGSINVMEYLLEQLAERGGDVNGVCGADRASVLHCALAGGTHNMADVIHLLLKYGADPNLVSTLGDAKMELRLHHQICGANFGSFFPEVEASDWKVSSLPGSVCETSFLELELEESRKSRQEAVRAMASAENHHDGLQDRAFDVLLSDVKNAVYCTDEFRMYSFKVRPCSRAYSHDWTECPFAHPGENARRRDPRRYHYSCVPCPDYRKGACQQGDACEYAHGVFESWLHPAQYRTRLCKDGTSCARKVCFFAHTKQEVRSLYVSAECGVSPVSSPFVSSPSVKSPILPGGMNLGPSSSPSLMACAWTASGLPVLRLPDGVERPRKPRASLISTRDVAVDRDLAFLSAQARINSAVVASSNSLAASASDRKNQSLLPDFEDSMYSLASPRSPLQMGVQAFSQTISKFNDSSRGDSVMEEIIAGLMSSSGASIRSSRSLQGQCDGWGQTGILGSPNLTQKMTVPSLSSHAEVSCLQKRSKESNICSSPSRREEKVWLDWGSPTGKPEWGVSGDDLARFRKSCSCKV